MMPPPLKNENYQINPTPTLSYRTTLVQLILSNLRTYIDSIVFQLDIDSS